MKWTPHAGQKIGIKFLLEHACAVLAADPGVGKTSMVYAAFKILKNKGLASKMLVVAPLKPCYLVWPKEQEKWSDFQGFKVVVLHGDSRDLDLIEEADICVINPEGLDWLLEVEKTKSQARSGATRTQVSVDVRKFKQLGFDTLVLDELTRFKNHQSGRSKALRTVTNTFARRWGLTGSLVANGLMDLFGQYMAIDQGQSFGQYITHFRTEYFVPDFRGFSYSLAKGAQERIYEKIRPLTLRLAAEDFVDMPELVEVPHVFELPPKVLKLYIELEDEMFAQIDEKTLVASNAAAVSTKCRQIANGGVYLDPDLIARLEGKLQRNGQREWLHLHTEKVDILEDLIEELQGDPLLVAYDFEHDLDRLRIKFGKDVPYIGGGVAPKRFIELEKAWNAGELPLLLAHPQSVAHGLNLQQQGRHVAWHSLTWDLELYDQFIRRIRRQGSSAKRVFVHHLIAKGTVDETILKALKGKDRGQTALYQALKMSRKTRK